LRHTTHQHYHPTFLRVAPLRPPIGELPQPTCPSLAFSRAKTDETKPNRIDLLVTSHFSLQDNFLELHRVFLDTSVLSHAQVSTYLVRLRLLVFPCLLYLSHRNLSRDIVTLPLLHACQLPPSRLFVSDRIASMSLTPARDSTSSNLHNGGRRGHVVRRSPKERLWSTTDDPALDDWVG
jgi:hypothetical protein